MTTASEPVSTTPPGHVRASFWILIVCAALRLFVVLVIAVSWSSLTTQAMKNLHYTTAQAHTTLTVSIVEDAVFCGVYVLFAYLIRAGRNWARITLTVIVVVFGLYDILGASDVLTLASVIIELVAVGLLYTAASKQYFAAVKAARQP